MARLVFGMNQSLDGYVDHLSFGPSAALFRHFIEEAEGQAGSLYGRHVYELMRYWDDDQPDWDDERRAFAAAWRRQPKWVVSRSLESVGPNATLIRDDLERTIRRLKDERVLAFLALPGTTLESAPLLICCTRRAAAMISPMPA